MSNTGMPMAASSAGGRFLEAHLDFLARGDVEGLLRSHYWPDAVLVTPERVVAGHEALRAYFAAHLAALGDFSVESFDALSQGPDAILLEATMSSGLGRARVYDAFALRAGRITHHFAGMIQRM